MSLTQYINTSEFNAWRNAKNRCYNKNGQSYFKYGERGITMCDRWRFGEDGKHGFLCFLEDMGLRPTTKHSLDRLDNDGDYTPQNCHWATAYQQTHNRRPIKAHRRKGSHQYIGVGLQGSSWRVVQRIDGGGQVQLGGFKDPLEAAYIRDQIVLQGRDPERSELNVLQPSDRFFID